MPPRRRSVFAAVAALGLASPLFARPVVHELVPFAPGERDPQPITAPLFVRSPESAAANAVAESGLPEALDYHGTTITAPTADAEPREGEAVLRPYAPPPSAGSASAPVQPSSPLQPDEP